MSGQLESKICTRQPPPEHPRAKQVSPPSYVLVTTARNEAAYLPTLIQSVTAQTHPPCHWIIVSDGSTDETEMIVRSASEKYSYIELLQLDSSEERNFESKAQAIAEGYRILSSIDHELVGILDADVSFKPNYYEQLLQRFAQDPRLGIAGGVLMDVIKGRPIKQLTASAWSVSGPVQMFRKECWREIGGYLQIRSGIDAAAEVMARMKGWKVRAFPELCALHHRPTGTQGHSACGVFFDRGQQVYQLGYHPLFFLASTIRYLQAPPIVIGGLIMLSGYCWAGLSLKKKMIPDDIVRYLRREQLWRLLNVFNCKQGNPG